MNSFKLILPFSENIYLFENLNIDNNRLIKELKKCKFKTTSNYNKTYVTEHFKILDKIVYGEELKNIFFDKIKIAINAMNYNTSFKIGTSWATLTKTKSESHYHVHSNYWLSACYYPMGNDEDNFKIMFKRPTPLFYDIPVKSYSSNNSIDYTLNVKEGDLIIFSSYLDHKICFNETKRERISLALNITPDGIIGKDDSYFNYIYN